MPNKVLVTGATGFVGRELCARLTDAGNDVIAIGRSRKVTGISCFSYHGMDLETADLKGAFSAGVDSVVHLAGQAHGKGGTESQQLDGFRRANVNVSTRLAEEAIQAGIRRFVFVSSIGVHGTTTKERAISESSPFSPASPYAQSKMEAERELIRLFDGAGSSELTIVRPPLVYGVHAPGNFGSLLKLANSPIPLPFGGCSNRRSLISVASLADFLVSCIHHPAAGNQSFVVSDSSVVSTGDIVASLRQGMNRSARLIPVPPSLMATMLGLLGKGDMYTQLFNDLEIDNRKAKTLVDWIPCQNSKLELVNVGRFYADSCTQS